MAELVIIKSARLDSLLSRKWMPLWHLTRARVSFQILCKFITSFSCIVFGVRDSTPFVYHFNDFDDICGSFECSLLSHTIGMGAAADSWEINAIRSDIVSIVMRLHNIQFRCFLFSNRSRSSVQSINLCFICVKSRTEGFVDFVTKTFNQIQCPFSHFSAFPASLSVYSIELLRLPPALL